MEKERRKMEDREQCTLLISPKKSLLLYHWFWLMEKRMSRKDAMAILKYAIQNYVMTGETICIGKVQQPKKDLYISHKDIRLSIYMRGNQPLNEYVYKLEEYGVRISPALCKILTCCIKVTQEEDWLPGIYDLKLFGIPAPDINIKTPVVKESRTEVVTSSVEIEKSTEIRKNAKIEKPMFLSGLTGMIPD